MKNTSAVATWIVSRALIAASAIALVACNGTGNGDNMQYMDVATPTVDYVEQLDVYSAPHRDSFLNQLAMNYRSYGIYNARTSGYPEMGELFAQKAVAAFSGELPFPETLENWPVDDEETSFELYTAYNELLDQLKNDASDTNPELAAEAQAKFDCWLSATASGQMDTASECRGRFMKTMAALRDCKNGRIVQNRTDVLATESATETTVTIAEHTVVTNSSNRPTAEYYPETRNMAAMNDNNARAREGVIIVNNVNIPEYLITPEPVPASNTTNQPIIFNQHIYGGDKSVRNSNNNIANDSSTTTSRCLSYTETGGCAVFAPTVNTEADTVAESEPEPIAEDLAPIHEDPLMMPPAPMISDELVTREEFINMMMAMRSELAAINARLDKIQATSDEKTIIKVQQIPLEPKQHVMEEVFEIRFDFDKSTIKPEYQELIKHLADATQSNKNIKVSVIGHTDTMGSTNYNYALGGRRAMAVQKMLIKYGIPASQIVAVSAGEEDLAVQTGDGVANAANRRVQVIKEVHYTEPAPQPVTIVEEYSATEPCGMYGCDIE